MRLAASSRNATGLPAEIRGLTDRGWLKPSMVADITVFDPQIFRNRATFDEPYLPPTGVRYVLVAGAVGVYDGQTTGPLNGRSLRKRPANR